MEDFINVKKEDVTAKLGMWIFIFTEILLFGGLFLVYAVMRHRYQSEFHQGALQLNTFIGTLNTVILLISSMTVAMSITAIQKNNKQLAKMLLTITLLCSIIFMANKYYEWGHKISIHLYPGSDLMVTLKQGYLIFFSLYFCLTGLHLLHLVVGTVILIIALVKIQMGIITKEHYVLLENGGLYWHLVDMIWIFLFPLLYLIT